MSPKQLIYKASKLLGLFSLTAWLTRNHLRILCYHGFALHDEHRFRPKLFIHPQTFALRMRTLHKQGLAVLALSEAIDRLSAGTLPPCAVVITIDDGFHGVFQKALPVLIEHHFPATVYVTTYYVQHQNPIFRLVVQYMFWKTNKPCLDTSGLSTGPAAQLDLRNAAKRDRWIWEFIEHAETHCPESDRIALSRQLGQRLGVDYGELVQNRALSLMTVEEVRALLANSVDIQLHTHRHRFPAEQSLALSELQDNNAVLQQITGNRGIHFCYPSGLWSKQHWASLKEFGVRTGVTCEPGLNRQDTPPFALLRFLDGENVSQIEFEAEISGFAELLRSARAIFRGRENHRAPD